MENKNNKGLITLLIVIIVILLGLCVLFSTGTISFKSNDVDNNEINQNINENNNVEIDDTNNNSQEDIENNQNKYNEDFSGIVEVIGYPIIKNKVDELGDGKEYSYVYFYIMESNKKEFNAYIEKLNGNMFVLDNAIGIGCIINNQIKYYNASDENGEKEYILSIDISNQILNAREDSPIKLKLERFPLTDGKGAPVCYSHITIIDIIK